MEDHFEQSFSDAKPEPALAPDAARVKATAAAAPATVVASRTSAHSAAEFLHSQDVDPTNPGDLWPEAADARCSESAALFSGTQPAPLSVV